MNLERRHVPLEGGSNMRDIGGYATADGRRVRWGLVYRSGALWRLTPADWSWMTDRNIATVVDLRSREECALSPTCWAGGDATRHLGVPYDADRLFAGKSFSGEGGREHGDGVTTLEASLYLVFAELLAPALKLFLGALAEGHMPAIIHCSAGQDRTGLAIGLLLALLGVPRSAIVEDYQLSTRFRRTENEMDVAAIATAGDTNVFARFYADALHHRGGDPFKPKLLVNRAGDPLLFDAFGAIEQRWGSIERFCDDVLDFDGGRRELLKAACLEPASPVSDGLSA